MTEQEATDLLYRTIFPERAAADRIAKLEAQRDALVAALQDMLNNFAGNDRETPFIVAARAALALVRE